MSPKKTYEGVVEWEEMDGRLNPVHCRKVERIEASSLDEASILLYQIHSLEGHRNIVITELTLYGF